MSDVNQKIVKQLDILRYFIHENIDADYVYVDIPLYWNIGDWLIAMGAWELLKEVPYKCLGKLRWEDYERVNITPDTIIVLQGGGNFGELSRAATDARNEVIEHYPDNKIIILSQTITYTDTSLLKKDAEIYSKHKNLHICARDNESFALAIEYFKANHVYLLPDTAFGLYPVLPKYRGVKTGITLIINRKDKEADRLFNERGIVKDWDDILHDIHFNIVYTPYRLIRKIRKITAVIGFYNIEHWYTLHVLYPYVRKHVPRYFLKFDKVCTTRLHGYILAILMHIPTEIRDTKYHKVLNYTNTWMQ